jgi:gamma-glutamylcyclotransferase
MHMSTFKYFAYGSNMSTKRLRARTPSAKVIDIATLTGHRLAFHKVSTKDGSGKCDVIEADAGSVMGVLFEIEQTDKAELDRFEGLNHGYREKSVNVELSSGAIERATTYVATNTNPDLKPFTWYKRHVVEGAKKANLSEPYVKSLEAVPAIEDPDKAREAEELAIYS